MLQIEAVQLPRTMPSSERSWARDWRLAGQGLARCFKGWRVWALLGVGDMRLRHKRSRFGQCWITLSTAFLAAALGALALVALPGFVRCRARIVCWL